jgi:hypothetical protein
MIQLSRRLRGGCGQFGKTLGDLGGVGYLTESPANQPETMPLTRAVRPSSDRFEKPSSQAHNRPQARRSGE